MEPTEEDRRRLTRAIELSRNCPPADGAFSVGAIIVDAEGDEISYGWSRETDAHVHAEESALAKLAAGPRTSPQMAERLRSSTIYSSLEPCGERKSRPLTCAQLILAAGIPRVVFAWREPALFVAVNRGAEILARASVTVVEVPDLAPLVRAVNSHLTLGEG